jgi:hypothetical protein
MPLIAAIGIQTPGKARIDYFFSFETLGLLGPMEPVTRPTSRRDFF